MFISVSGIGIFFRYRQADGQLWTGMGTGQACLAMSRKMNSLSIHNPYRAGRTDTFANPAANAGVRYF